MTYRASLGTRGELRRIAAEAETVTIDRVRPWIRKVQHCRLAPHVIVPQWTRLEHPVKPKPPPPLVSQSRLFAGELIEEVLETVTAKKFRRGRGRRGRPRKRADTAVNPDLASGENAEAASKPLEVTPSNTEHVLAVTEPIVETTNGAQDIDGLPEAQKSDENALGTRESIKTHDGEPQTDIANNGEDIVKAQIETEERSKKETEPKVEEDIETESLQRTDPIPPNEKEPATEQDSNIEMTPVVSEKVTEEENIDKDVEMATGAPAETSTGISKKPSP